MCGKVEFVVRPIGRVGSVGLLLWILWRRLEWLALWLVLRLVVLLLLLLLVLLEVEEVLVGIFSRRGGVLVAESPVVWRRLH